MPWTVHRRWAGHGGTVLAALRPLITWKDDRATGWLYLQDRPPVTDWPPLFAETGPWLLERLAETVCYDFTAVCFQAYRDGTGCDWHHDRDWGAQAILSLGVTRSFGIRDAAGNEEFLHLSGGDLLVMPPGFQDGHEHCVPVEDVPGERLSIVFRTTN